MVNQNLLKIEIQARGFNPVYNELGEITGYSNEQGQVENIPKGTTAEGFIGLTLLGASETPATLGTQAASRLGTRTRVKPRTPGATQSAADLLKQSDVDVKNQQLLTNVQKAFKELEEDAKFLETQGFKTKGTPRVGINTDGTAKGGVRGLEISFKENAKTKGLFRALWEKATPKGVVKTFVGLGALGWITKSAIESIQMGHWAGKEGVDAAGMAEYLSYKDYKQTGDPTLFLETSKAAQEVRDMETSNIPWLEGGQQFPVKGAGQDVLANYFKSEKELIEEQEDLQKLTEEKLRMETLILNQRAEDAANDLKNKALDEEDFATQMVQNKRDAEGNIIGFEAKTDDAGNPITRNKAVTIEKGENAKRKAKANRRPSPTPRKGKGAAPLPGAGQSIRKAPEERKKIGGLL